MSVFESYLILSELSNFYVTRSDAK